MLALLFLLQISAELAFPPAILDLQRVLSESAEWKTVVAKFEAARLEHEKALSSKRAAIQTLIEKKATAAIVDRSQVDLKRMTEDAEVQLTDLQRALRVDFFKKVEPRLDGLDRHGGEGDHGTSAAYLMTRVCKIANQRVVRCELAGEPSGELWGVASPWKIPFQRRRAATKPLAPIVVAGATTKNTGTVNHMRRSRGCPGSESRINAISTTVLTDMAKVRTGSRGVRHAILATIQPLATKGNPITIHIRIPLSHQPAEYGCAKPFVIT